MKMLTFDSSTKKTGVAFFIDGNLSEYKLIDFSEIKDTDKRIVKMCEGILKVLNEYSPDSVYAEDTWNAKNLATSKLLTKVLGVIFGWCIEHKVDYTTLLPSQWRKNAGISLVDENKKKKQRQQLKQNSMDYVKNKYDITVNDDVADAIVIGDSIIMKCDFE